MLPLLPSLPPSGRNRKQSLSTLWLYGKKPYVQQDSILNNKQDNEPQQFLYPILSQGDVTLLLPHDNHLRGVVNALETRTDSAKHENVNGKIQAILAKARGFKNFDRFRVNVLFYFGKLDIFPLKI